MANLNKLYRYFLSFMIIPVCLALTCCNQTSQEPFRIGTNLWVGYQPLYLARENKYFDRHTRLVEFPNATEVLRSFRNHTLEAACVSLDEALLLRQYGIPISVILVTDFANSGNAILTRDDIHDMKHLSEKVIGVESGALGAYFLARALKMNNMTLNDVKIRRLAVDVHKDMFLAGKIDAVVTFDPIRSQLLANKAKEIFSGREISDEIIGVIVIRNDLPKNHEKQITNLVRAWFMALADINKHPQQTAEFFSDHLKISPAQVLSALQDIRQPDVEENRKLLARPNPKLAEHVRKLKKIMEQEQLLHPGVSVDNMLKGNYL